MKTRVYLSRWKSPQAEQRFRVMEDAFWQEFWPEPPTAFDIETHLGPSRAYRWAGTGDPLVFLHGAGGTALMWSDFIDRLDGRTVYAIDTIGDVGRSEQRIPVEDAADLARWLDAVLTGLGIERAHLAGSSYGGFLALNLAVHEPARVLSVSLLDPVGIVPFHMGRFLRWGGAVLFSSLLPGPLRRRAARVLRMPALESKAIMRLVRHGQLTHRSVFVPPGPFTDDELRSITAPVLLLLGEKSEIHRSRDVKARAEALLRDVEVEIVVGAGHALPMSHTEAAAARIVDFLRGADLRTP